jgi:hypothetical protein
LTCPGSVTSVSTAAFAGSFSSAQSALRRSTRRAPRISFAPSAARRRAAASPSPLLAPVMTTTLPAMFSDVMSFLALSRVLQ